MSVNRRRTDMSVDRLNGSTEMAPELGPCGCGLIFRIYELALVYLPFLVTLAFTSVICSVHHPLPAAAPALAGSRWFTLS